MNQTRDFHSFVLRIWWEEGAWRGRIQHAASGKIRYFARLADLLAFIEAQTGPLEQEWGEAGPGGENAP